MDKNKIIILALIVIIAAILVAMVAMMPNMNKQDTKLKFKGNSTITEGESIKIKLTDVNGTGIANQTINVTITDKDKSSDYHTVETNNKGVGTLNIDKNAGNYTITISYVGNDNYNGCNATKEITISEEVVETEPVQEAGYESSSDSSSASSSSSSSEPSDWTDSEGFDHYYENGQEYVGSREGQHMDIDMHNYVKEHGME